MENADRLPPPHRPGRVPSPVTPRVWGAWASPHKVHGHTQTPCVQEGAWLRHTVGSPEQVLLISRPTACLWGLGWEGDSGDERNCL